jgi:hypothetical protein
LNGSDHFSRKGDVAMVMTSVEQAVPEVSIVKPN